MAGWEKWLVAFVYTMILMANTKNYIDDANMAKETSGWMKLASAALMMISVAANALIVRMMLDI